MSNLLVIVLFLFQTLNHTVDVFLKTVDDAVL